MWVPVKVTISLFLRVLFQLYHQAVHLKILLQSEILLIREKLRLFLLVLLETQLLVWFLYDLFDFTRVFDFISISLLFCYILQEMARILESSLVG